MGRTRPALPHPRPYRRTIFATALVAMATWWGLGLPYSLFTWLLDPQQLTWVLICYAWEVPACGFFGPVLFPLLWWRDIERRWDRIVEGGAPPDPAQVAALERTMLDYPAHVAVVLLVSSLVGYGVGAAQVRVFAQLPMIEVVKICTLGVVTGMVGALFAFLYLEWRIEPLLRRLGAIDATRPPAGRRIPLYAKVFGCSLILTISGLLLLGTIFYSRGERILEEEVGHRVLAEARHLAAELGPEVRDVDPASWRARESRMQLGPSGYAYLVDGGGRVLAGSSGVRHLDEEGFRPAVVRRILQGDGGHLVDRAWSPRIVAFAAVRGPGGARVVTVVHRREFARELDSMLRRGGLVFAMTLILALTQGFLFSHRLTRPIEIVTRMASKIAQAPEESWERVPVRTNDEVGTLSTAFNLMTGRLEEARHELERHSAELARRVAEATRNVTTLYDVARTTTSTLELDAVLQLVAEKTLSALDLDHLVVLWYLPDLDGAVEAYSTGGGTAGERRLEIGTPVDLQRLCAEPRLPAIAAASSLDGVPEAVAQTLDSAEVLCLPLVFKDQLLGVILAALDPRGGPPDLELAGTLASQAAAALANAILFETVRRHEAELRELSQMRAQLQEESVRTLSRELHDGVGQVLTAIKIDLGMIERAGDLARGELQARVRDVRDQVTELLQEVRTMSQLLRPSMLDDFGLVPTLQWLMEKFSLRTHIAVRLDTPPAETRLPSPIEVLLYRVTQEALTNVMKHAQASQVSVDLALRPGEVVLAIADDGVGFDVERFRRNPALGGVGLLGMRERVAYYGGRIDISSRPRSGVRIVLTIPVAGAGTGEAGPVTLAS